MVGVAVAISIGDSQCRNAAISFDFIVVVKLSNATLALETR